MVKVTIPGKVSLKDIDLGDDAFSISYPKFLETLKTSIQEIGLLTPLILRNKNSSLQIISGYRRGIVLKEFGVDFIPAYIFKKFISLQNLIDGIKTLAVVKKFPLKTLAKLSLLSDKDQESFLELATELSLGFNLVNEFLTLLEEIAAIDRVSISDL